MPTPPVNPIAAVDHQQLAVGAIIHAREVVPAQRPIFAKVDARLRHRLDRVVVHFLAAKPVNQHVDLDSGARALGERFGEALADLAGPVDVRFEVDSLLRHR